MTDKHQQMFGVSDINQWWYSNTAHLFIADTPHERKMMVMGMLSDVQEMIERGLHEDARQTLNRAKWVVREKI